MLHPARPVWQLNNEDDEKLASSFDPNETAVSLMRVARADLI